MATASIGKKVPAFNLPATGEQNIKLASLKDKNIVIYFYPKDNTSGCTTEGQNFRDEHTKFKRQNTIILGVSRDSIKSHENFKEKQNFPFDLISDSDEILCKIFDVIKMKNMYGKKALGVERSTFLIDTSGKLQQEWRKVKVDGHVNEVLDAVKALNKSN
ncbi:MAG: peroxiredoxin [Gammaproteobacteria bacterium]|nr:peroxiredoxin [Gammaproteobacteria bacterium]